MKGQDEILCAICFDIINLNDRIKILECDHIFHYDCINRWRKTSMTPDRLYSCPVCRATQVYYPPIPKYMIINRLLYLF